MARFSSSFIQGLANPSYADGLFTAGQKLGAAPGVAREEQEKKRRQKDLIGASMALQKFASSGDLTHGMLSDAAGSLSALGMNHSEIMNTVDNARALNTSAIQRNMRSSLNEDFVERANQRRYGENVIRDVSRSIKAGQIANLSAALESAQNQTVEENKQDYYSILSAYDPRLSALVQRGQYDRADQLYAALNPPKKEQEADKLMEDFYAGGGILNSENRQDIFNAIRHSSDGLNQAITTMNSLETQSFRNITAQHKGPTRKITYIPKGSEYSLETGNVDTKTIDAPVDPKTGEIQKEWLDDFVNFSAKKIIGMSDLTPEDSKNDVEDGQDLSSVNEPNSVTPRKLLNNFSSTADM